MLGMLTTDNQLGDPGAGLFLTSEKAVFCNFKFRFCIQNGREIALTMEGLHCSLIPNWVNVPEQPPCQLQLLQLQHLPSLLLQKEGNLPLGNESEARLPEGGQPGGQPGWFSSTDPSTSPSTIASTNPSNTFFASPLWDPVGGITDGEVNQREMTPDSDSISVSIVQYSFSRKLPQDAPFESKYEVSLNCRNLRYFEKN